MTPEQISIGVLAVSIVGLGFRFFQFRRNHWKSLSERLNSIDRRLSRLEGRVEEHLKG